MGSRGPLPKTEQALRLSGSWRGKKKRRRCERPTAAPKKPVWLSKPAQARWRAVVAVLRENGTLRECDRDVIAAYCETWCLYEKLTRAAARMSIEQLSGDAVPALLHQAHIRLLGLTARLGISPADRERVRPAPPKTADPADKFLE